MTPVVTNSAATMVVTNTHSDSNDRDSDYYKDSMNQYKIDEEFAKTKSDKAKAQKLYQYSYKRYKQEKHSEKIFGRVVIGITAVIAVLFIWWIVAMIRY